MAPALILNLLLFPIRWIINGIRTLIYKARGAINTTGVYLERDRRDDRIMIVEVDDGQQKHRVRLYVDFDNHMKKLSKLYMGDTVDIFWIPGARWCMGR